MSDNIGWISIHRQIQKHWIWKDANKLKWWLDMLLTVNTSESKVNIGYDIFYCKRGESLLSIQSWADRWGVSKDTARNFLYLLEKENMIIRVSIGKSTRITICKYDYYQKGLHVKQTYPVRDTNTNNKDNKDNKLISNDINVGLPSSTPTISFEDRCKGFISEFNKIRNSKYQVTDNVRKKLKPRLKNYSSKDIISALKKSITDPFHIDSNLNYITPEYILREDILERYLNVTEFVNNKTETVQSRPIPINHDLRP